MLEVERDRQGLDPGPQLHLRARLALRRRAGQPSHMALLAACALAHRGDMPGIANLDRRDVLHHGALNFTRRLDWPATLTNGRERVLHRLVDLRGNGPIAPLGPARAPRSAPR